MARATTGTRSGSGAARTQPREGEALFATAAKGTEGALRDELRALRFRDVRADRGGVHFRGSLAEGYRACLELRTAMRVLVEVAHFEAPSEVALYEGVRAIDLGAYLSTETTLAVRASVRSSRLTHSHYVALKTKDAIVDRLRDELGARPDVDTEDPDVLVSVHLAKDVATVYLDLSGEPLFMRGYRGDQRAAPLKETLAASLVVLSGWRGDELFVDPMTGSGTIAIEAALFAARVAPGLVQKRGFGFERWRSFGERERRAWGELVEAARERGARGLAETRDLVVARDLDPRALEATRENAARAGVQLRIEEKDAAELALDEPSTVILNPPYGERIALEPESTRAIGRALARLSRSTVGVITADPGFLEAIPRRYTRYVDLMNGDLESRFAMFERRS
ncbi:MAG: THUMP domain-containing protein [Polyangiaceae bacterium]